MAPSITAFFPCYNDKGTIATMVVEVRKVLEKIADDFEIIVIDDGSQDGSRELLTTLQYDVAQLKLIFHERNKGYGDTLRDGFTAAAKDLVFYTDGDGQYDVKELTKLLEKMDTGVDIVNGYKIKRSDPWQRIVIGAVYQYAMKFAFLLPIRDPDCDFRLMRRQKLQALNLTSDTGTICIELVKKLQRHGAQFCEVGVSHYFRTYGTSQFFNFKRIFKTLYQLVFLWIDLMVLQKGRLS